MITAAPVDLKTMTEAMRRGLRSNNFPLFEEAREVQKRGRKCIAVFGLNEAAMLSLGIVLPQSFAISASVLMAPEGDGHFWDDEVIQQSCYCILGEHEGFLEARGVRKAFRDEPLSETWSNEFHEASSGDYCAFDVAPRGTLALLIVKEADDRRSRQ